MATAEGNCATARFAYTFRSILGQDERLEANVPVPFVGDVSELAQQIVAGHSSDPMVKFMDIQDGILI